MQVNADAGAYAGLGLGLAGRAGGAVDAAGVDLVALKASPLAKLGNAMV
jgi:hypothetical protein